LDIAATIGGETGSNDGMSLLNPINEDRRVFSQARGLDEQSHLRRYAVRTQTGACFCERNQNSGSVEFTQVSDSLLRSELEAHVKQRVRAENGHTEDGEENIDDEIERRLSALGYKE
jgi:arylsulfatase